MKSSRATKPKRPAKIAAWTTRVPLSKLSQIWNSLHDMMAPALHDEILDAIWARRSRAARLPWPRKNGIVHLCECAENADDPDHQIVRTLPQQLLFSSGVGILYQCCCGRRDAMQHAHRQLHLKSQRINPSPKVWPQRRVDGQLFYAVCKFAADPSDINHAPRIPVLLHDAECICGGYIGENNRSGKDDVLFSVKSLTKRSIKQTTKRLIKRP